MANEIATAYLALVPTLKGAQASITKQLNGVDTTAAGRGMGDKASAGFGSGFASVKGVLTTIAASAAVGFAAEFTKSAISAFSDYEQLAGGVEKIFDEMDYSKILGDAQEAYRELGMSANEYLTAINQTGASFAATMGDEAGYETARLGMMAISDYASGTGRSVSELTDKFSLITRSTASYQSIADQFSGILPATSADFLAQAQAAGALSGEYEKLTEVPIEEYQAAVAAMLEQGVAAMGLTGNTLAEAEGTISGSLAAMSASWENWIAGLADEDANVEELTSRLVETVAAAAGNIIPRIGEVVANLGALMSEQLPIIINDITTYITENSGQMADAALNFLGQMVPALLQVGVALVANAAIMVDGLLKSLLERAVDFMAAGGDMIGGIVEGIKDGAFKVWDAIKEVCANALDAVKDFFGIASPSKVMREMFGYVGEGMALGLSDSESTVNAAMKHLVTGAEGIAADFNPTIGASLTPYGYKAGGNNITVYIEGRDLAGINAIDQFVEMVEMQARLNPTGI